jgi:cystathionine beta-lyase/cystathionine gamma-synthase
LIKVHSELAFAKLTQRRLSAFGSVLSVTLKDSNIYSQLVLLLKPFRIAKDVTTITTFKKHFVTYKNIPDQLLTEYTLNFYDDNSAGR